MREVGADGRVSTDASVHDDCRHAGADVTERRLWRRRLRRPATQHKAVYRRSPVGELWVARAPRGAPQDWRKWVADEQGKARVIVRKGGNADCILPPHPGPLSAFPKRTTGRTRCSPLRTVPTDSLGLVYSHPIHPVHLSTQLLQPKKHRLAFCL